MIHILGGIPNKIAIAVSGGVDSMAVLDFLRRSRDVVVVHYNHGTGKYADEATSLVLSYCEKHDIECMLSTNTEVMPKGVSPEAWWREKRYTWFDSATDRRIITAHHLCDVVENWIFTSLNGNPFLIPRDRGQYLRPFLITDKLDLEDWCRRKDVPFIVDPSNTNTKYRRNYIRHKMMTHVEHINPGIKKTIRKKVIKSFVP